MVVFVVGCKGDRPEPATYRYRLQISPSDTSLAPHGARVMVAGNAMSKDGMVNIPRAVHLYDPATKAVAEYDTTCGTATLPLHTDLGREAELDSRKLARNSKDTSSPYDVLATYNVDPSVAVAPLHPIYVDNAGNAKPATVKIGAIERVVDPGRALQFSVYVGSCDTGRDVLVDGVKLGTVEVEKATLVDVTGTHCYFTTMTLYAKPGAGRDPGMPPEMVFSATSTADHRVHVAPRVSDFLSSAPETEVVYGDQMASRLGLQRKGCSQKTR
jgi:hypothetical protein